MASAKILPRREAVSPQQDETAAPTTTPAMPPPPMVAPVVSTVQAEPPAPPPAPVTAPASAPPTQATYRVWPHGTLRRQRRTYQPGETLILPIDEAAKIPCLERVD